MGHLSRHSIDPICLSLTNYCGNEVRCIFHFKDQGYHGCYAFGYRILRGLPNKEIKKFKVIPYDLIELNALVKQKKRSYNFCFYRYIGCIIMILVLFFTLVSNIKIEAFEMVKKFLSWF